MGMKLTDLQKCHPDYDPKRVLPSGVQRGVLQVHQELYEGGLAFSRVKDLYLRPRMADTNSDYKKARLACAEFGPTAGPVIDWSAGQCVAETPRIEGAEYYEELTYDVDGNGTDLAEQARQIAVTLMVHRRAYLGVDFPSQDELATPTMRDAKAAGKLNGRICKYDPACVEDWRTDRYGQLVFVRLHYVEIPEKDNLPGDVEKHTWYFITPEKTEEYTAERKVGAIGWEANQEAEYVGEEFHDYFPIVNISLPAGLWAMNRVAGLEIDAFNLATGLTYLDEAVCFQQLVISSDRGDVSAVATNEKVALKLNQGEQAQWLAPSMAPLDSLDKQVQNKQMAIRQALLSIGLTSSNDRYGQQSGEAKDKQMQPAVDMLACYKSPIKDAYEKALAIIKKVRKEENEETKILGLGEIEDDEAEEEAAKEKNEDPKAPGSEKEDDDASKSGGGPAKDYTG